jgi:hypothetical protein
VSGRSAERRATAAAGERSSTAAAPPPVAGGERADGHPRVPAACAAALHAYLLLALAASFEPGLTPHLGLPLALLAFGCGWRAVGWLRAEAAPGRSDWTLYVGLSALAAVPLLAPPPGLGLRAFDLGALVPVATLVLLGVHAAGGVRQRRWALTGIVVPTLALQALAPLSSPEPMIDVWQWTQFCARALLAGVHPYTVQAPDVYRGGFNFGYTTTVYPYLPLNLLASLPGVALCGDYRYMLGASAVAAVVLVRAAGRRLGVEARLLDLITLALALHPRAAFIIGMGWKEPLLVLALTAFLYLRVRAPSGAGQAVAFFCLPALKQYVVAPVALYLADALGPGPERARRIRSALIGVLVAAATLAPFLAWKFRATLDGVLFAMGHTTFRTDSLSVTAVVTRFTGYAFGKSLGIVAQLVVGALAMLRLRRLGPWPHASGGSSSVLSLAGLLLASGMSLFACFLLGSQAFTNYYYFVAALLLCAALVAATAPARDRETIPASETPPSPASALRAT